MAPPFRRLTRRVRTRRGIEVLRLENEEKYMRTMPFYDGNQMVVAYYRYSS